MFIKIPARLPYVNRVASERNAVNSIYSVMCEPELMFLVQIDLFLSTIIGQIFDSLQGAEKSTFTLYLLPNFFMLWETLWMCGIT